MLVQTHAPFPTNAGTSSVDLDRVLTLDCARLTSVGISRTGQEGTSGRVKSSQATPANTPGRSLKFSPRRTGSRWSLGELFFSPVLFFLHRRGRHAETFLRTCSKFRCWLRSACSIVVFRCSNLPYNVATQTDRPSNAARGAGWLDFSAKAFFHFPSIFLPEAHPLSTPRCHRTQAIRYLPSKPSLQ